MVLKPVFMFLKTVQLLQSRSPLVQVDFNRNRITNRNYVNIKIILICQKSQIFNKTPLPLKYQNPTFKLQLLATRRKPRSKVQKPPSRDQKSARTLFEHRRRNRPTNRIRLRLRPKSYCETAYKPLKSRNTKNT